MSSLYGRLREEVIEVEPVEVEVWLKSISEDHKFRSSPGSYARGNDNLDVMLSKDVVLTNGPERLQLPAGTNVCMFQAYSGNSRGTIATAFLEDRIVNFLPGGKWKERPKPSGGLGV